MLITIWKIGKFIWKEGKKKLTIAIHGTKTF